MTRHRVPSRSPSSRPCSLVGSAVPARCAGGATRRSSCSSTRRRSRARREPDARIDARAARVPRASSRRSVPAARVGWRYRLVANGFSLVASRVASSRASARLPGVRDVLPAGSYAPQLASTPQQIGAPALWGPTLDTAGQGVKIGIIDSGIDPSTRSSTRPGYTMPAGFPEGSAALHDREGDRRARRSRRSGATAPSARACRSATTTRATARTSPASPPATPTPPAGGGRVSGVAPRAYLGNYKVFVETDSGLEPERELARDRRRDRGRRRRRDGRHQLLGRRAGDRAEPRHRRARARRGRRGRRRAGRRGRERLQRLRRRLGLVARQLRSARSRVGAVEISGSPTTRRTPTFSSVGPTTISLRLKPDVAAPGVDVLSSVPGGGWAAFSGTSMAAPHVAGAAALLRQRHPAWTVAQIKSALVQTGVGLARRDGGRAPVRASRAAASSHCTRADRPLLFAEPTALSFGLIAHGADDARVRSASTTPAAARARGTSTTSFAGAPNGARSRRSRDGDASRRARPSTSPSRAARSARGSRRATSSSDAGPRRRRIPFWGRVDGRCSRESTTTLTLDEPGAVPRHDRAAAGPRRRATATRRTRAASASRRSCEARSGSSASS